MVSIDVGWLPYVIGACKVLTANSTYDPPTAADVVNAVKAAYDLLADLEDGYFRNPCPSLSGSVGASGDEVQMIRQNPTNPCLLETSIDGVNWCVFADFSKCVSTAGPGSGQPQPQPGGGCSTYNFLHRASDTTYLGVNVNTGDTLQLISASGAGSDGTASWYCPDGQIFLAGACVGGQSTVSTDPAPTKYHMSLLWLIDGVYYPATGILFTVPSGVTNKSVYLVNNDSNLLDNSGQYSIGVQVCNNQAVGGVWCFEMDYHISPFGGSPQIFQNNGACGTPTQAWGHWVSGTGLQGSTYQELDCATNGSLLDFVFDLGATKTISSGTLGGSFGASGGNNSHSVSISNDPTFATGVTTLLFLAANNAGSYSENLTSSGTGRYVRVYQDNNPNPGTPGANSIVTSLLLRGTGTNPFGTDNCT